MENVKVGKRKERKRFMKNLANEVEPLYKKGLTYKEMENILNVDKNDMCRAVRILKDENRILPRRVWEKDRKNSPPPFTSSTEKASENVSMEDLFNLDFSQVMTSEQKGKIIDILHTKFPVKYKEMVIEILYKLL